MLLEFKNVSKTYEGSTGAVAAMADVSLSLTAGGFTAIRGPSGCGKSTLLLAAGGLLRPSGGSLLLDGCDVYALSPRDRAKLRAAAVGFVFQQFHLIPYLTVFDNVLAASIAAPPCPCGPPAADARQRTQELIDRFHLTDRAGHTPGQLSTGERQRTALARALLNRPRLLLADEPTGNLDPDNTAIVLDTLRHFADAGGAVLLVTHDDRAAAAAQRVVKMKEGRIE